ncbi:MAG: hypothetical protein F4149_17845 [Gammaproteobacteria bacterium]|nr:hypothetical protein [Gammaproteobacteria bacterium]
MKAFSSCLALVAGALLAVWPSGPTQAQGTDSTATYKVTFKGTWTTAATPGGVPSGAHFTTLIGPTHSNQVTFWQVGGMASAGVENVAELGSTGTFKSEINASSHVGTTIEIGVGSGGTPQASANFQATKSTPLVTLLSMIAPSPDWFVGVSGLSLLDAQNQWRSGFEMDLYPYDAGTEGGSGFSLSNPATVPQGTITSLRGTSPFSSQPMAKLIFARVGGDGGDGGDGSGGGSGGGGGGDRRPEPVGALEDRRLAPGGALTLDLSGSFRSRDGSDLTFTAASSEPSVAMASVDGSALTLRGLSDGSATITVTATDGGRNSLNRRFRVTVASPPAAWYLPPASHPVLRGFVRVVNHSDKAGEVRVTATDDAGMAYGPVTLSVDAHAAAHFNSHDLENGNAAKGLTGMTGPGMGGWRLRFDSDTLDVEALGYLRTTDGFVTSMSATASKGADGAFRLATFNPASNTNQVSVLRLVNPSGLEASATITGTDDSGSSPGSPVMLTVPSNAACEVDAVELESGSGLACGEPQAGLGDGTGKWRLSIETEAPLVAMGLLRSPTGHLSNLSGAVTADAEGVWHVPLFPSASDPSGRQGFARVASHADRAGSVRVRAFDDSDADHASPSLRLGAGEAKQFNSDDLEVGNAAKGLTGSTGSGTGDWRLALSGSTIDFEANAYVRHRDGFLTAMQAVAPSMAAEAPTTGRVHRIVTFNPGSNDRQVSVLRLVNRGTFDAVATVTGADDRGVGAASAVEVSVPDEKAVELTAAELESGMAEAIMSGALGDGAGKWRLRVASEGDLAVMSLLRSPGGQLTNLSGADEERTSALPSLLPPPSWVRAEDAGGRRVRAQWASVPAARYGVELLLGGEPIRSLKAAARTDFRWSDLEPGTYSVRVRSVDADGQVGPWGDPSNEVMVD